MYFILTWLLATSLMTLFSYVFYFVTKKEAREPYLLNSLYHMNIVNKPFMHNKAFGWIVHYLLGILFLLVNYGFCFVFGNTHWSWGLMYGLLAGLLGIMGWMGLFNVSRNTPTMDRRVFYIQLVVAHIIFCLTAMIVFQ